MGEPGSRWPYLNKYRQARLDAMESRETVKVQLPVFNRALLHEATARGARFKDLGKLLRFFSAVEKVEGRIIPYDLKKQVRRRVAKMAEEMCAYQMAVQDQDQNAATLAGQVAQYCQDVLAVIDSVLARKDIVIVVERPKSEGKQPT